MLVSRPLPLLTPDQPKVLDTLVTTEKAWHNQVVVLKLGFRVSHEPKAPLHH